MQMREGKSGMLKWWLVLFVAGAMRQLANYIITAWVKRKSRMTVLVESEGLCWRGRGSMRISFSSGLLSLLGSWIGGWAHLGIIGDGLFALLYDSPLMTTKMKVVMCEGVVGLSSNSASWSRGVLVRILVWVRSQIVGICRPCYGGI